MNDNRNNNNTNNINNIVQTCCCTWLMADLIMQGKLCLWSVRPPPPTQRLLQGLCISLCMHEPKDSRTRKMTFKEPRHVQYPLDTRTTSQALKSS